VDRSWTRGQPERIDVFSKTNKVKSTKYFYTSFKDQKVIAGFKSFANFGATYLPPQFNYDHPTADHLFQYTDITVETSLIKLTREIETVYSGQDSVSLITNYFYNRLDSQYEVTTIHKTNSDGSVSKIDFIYPNDLKDPSQQLDVYYNMSQRNMVSPVVMQIDSVNNRFIRSVHTKYDYWPIGQFFAPSEVEVKRENLPVERELDYQRYDSWGNLISVSRNDLMNETYHWGYNQSLPVAIIKGASYAELNSSGLLSDLDQLQNFTDINTPTLRNNLKVLNQIIRFNAPSNTMVYTYAYKSLAVITSETDPSGRTVFYEYDAFGRLIFVKDEDGNVLKEHKYNYAQ
jgi:YD repeat-containing protein